MSRAKKIKYIVIHCSAGFQPAEKVQRYFLRPKHQGGRGWNTGGYHDIIDRNGDVYDAYDYERITNGVYGYNDEAINICYIGGVNYEKSRSGIFIPEDTRTPTQKASIEKRIQNAILWLHDNGKDITEDLNIFGHYHFSPDQNRNGIIEKYERIKACPSFDAFEEYNYLYGATNSIQTLPSNR